MTNLSTLLSNSYIGAQGVQGIAGALKAWSIKSANYTAVDGDRIIANTTAGSFTITLPATPIIGAYVQITDGGNWAVNNLLINRNGSTIEGIADTVAIDIAQTTVEFTYDGSTWQFTSTTGARGPAGFVADDTAMIYSIALGF
jgi:hypothetical protein